MADQKREPCEASLIPKSNDVKPMAPNMQGDGVGNMKSDISASRVLSGELDFEMLSADSKREVDMQSSDGISSAVPTSMKSDISTETGLPLSSESSETGAMKTPNLNAAEDGLNPFLDFQQRTESSCSNSLSTVLPVQFSNQSYLETSKEMCSFRNGVVSTDSSNAKSFECSRLQEPVTASSDSGACHELDNLNTSHSVERLVHLEISRESKDASTVKDKLLEMVPEVTDKIKAESWANEPSEYSMHSMTKRGKVALESQDARIAGFDLNEDLNANGVGDYAQPAATASSQGVIQVVAKAGRPNGQPEIPLRFEGRLDWKGTGESSAFRPAGLSRSLESQSYSRNNKPKDPQGFMGIDLNVAVAEDNSVNGFSMEHPVISLSSPLQESHPEAGSDRPKSRPFIDLNCNYDVADDFTRPSQKPESRNSKLNKNSDMMIGDKSNILHQPSLDRHSIGNNTDAANPSRHYFNFIGHDYFRNAQIPVTAPNILQPVEFMQRVASLQPKLPLGSPALNLQNPMPSNICLPGTVMPYARYSHEQGIYPALLNPNTVHTSFCTPQLVQIVHEQGFNNLSATSFPYVNARTGDNLSTSRIKMDEARQFPFVTANPPTTGEHVHQQQQELWYDGSMKRKKPEGGFRHYHQLGYK